MNNQLISTMGSVKDNGGARKGAGRKPKADEHKLIERLTPLADAGYNALKDALSDGQGWAVKLFFEYMYGKPKQQIEQTTTLKTSDFDVTKLYDKKT